MQQMPHVRCVWPADAVSQWVAYQGSPLEESIRERFQGWRLGEWLRNGSTLAKYGRGEPN